jgi:predicted RNA-binding protein YlqC (UPF0109 family)
MAKQITREHMEALKALTLGVVRAVVDNSSSVEVNIIPSSYRLIVELHTEPSDVGQVIGKDGRVVSAIRTLLAAHGGREGLKIDMDFVTEKDARR